MPNTRIYFQLSCRRGPVLIVIPIYLLEHRCLSVNEKYTTQMGSSCGEISANSPKGRAGLGIRMFLCRVWYRDINAAKNIIRLGH